MDKNIAAIIRPDTKTVHVRFIGPAMQTEGSGFNTRIARRHLDPDKMFSDLGSDEDDSLPLVGSAYTYVTNFGVVVGDTVVVLAKGEIKLASVVKVDQDLSIEPNAPRKYEWLLAVIDFEPHRENVAKNAEIEKTLATAYMHSMRQQFANGIMASLPDSARENLQKLLGPTT